MIIVQENVKVGDVVYAWFSAYKENANKKHQETEFKMKTLEKDRIEIVSTSGDYSMVFNEELINSWNGNIRKA